MRMLVPSLTLIALLSASCGSPKPETRIEQPIDFKYILKNKMGSVAFLRDRPLVLVLMRTSEVVSQIHIQNIAKLFKKRAGELQFLVLTVEETEAPFVDTYAEVEDLPFPIGIAEKSVVLGESSMGVIPFIPYTCFIDHTGVVQTSAPGVLTVEEMIAEVDRLLDI